MLRLASGWRCPVKTVIRIITCLALFASLLPAAWAQDEQIGIDKLPPKAAATLKARFPAATVTSLTKTIENRQVVYDIEMTQGGRKHEMDVTEEGVIVNFENEIAVKDLPPAVMRAVQAKYPKCTFKEAMEVLVIKDQKDVLDEYEVLIVTANKKEVELAVSPDGKRIE
jgi:Putative beta-lactamase-inhibitor-like, PepSY-like